MQGASDVDATTGERTIVMHWPGDDSASCSEGGLLPADTGPSAVRSSASNNEGATDLHGVGDTQAGSSAQAVPVIPTRVMNGIHAYAFEFYQQGRLDEAEAFFRFLCLYDFYNADYAMGLAAVFQLKGRHRQAIDLYGVAMRLGFSDPSPVFHAGQCFLKLGEIEDARECFAYVLSEAVDVQLKERAGAYLSSIGGPPQRDDMIPASPFASDAIGGINE
jgi:type III secretion system low calcium response chaperone LcrH/SycD